MGTRIPTLFVLVTFIAVSGARMPRARATDVNFGDTWFKQRTQTLYAAVAPGDKAIRTAVKGAVGK